MAERLLKALEASKNMALAVLRQALEGEDVKAFREGKPIVATAAFENLSPESATDLISFHMDLNETFILNSIAAIAIAPTWGASNKYKIKEVRYTTVNGYPILTVKYEDGRVLAIGFTIYSIPFNYSGQKAEARALLIRVEPIEIEEVEEEGEGEGGGGGGNVGEDEEASSE